MKHRVSVCMPYYERLEEYEATLASFKAAGYFHSFSHVFNLEISVCDDGSKNNPVKECMDDRYIISRLPKKNHAMNPCVPLNKAVDQSTGDIILLQGPETRHRVPIIQKMVELLISAENPDMTTVLCPVKEDGPRVRCNGWRLHYEHQPRPLWFCQMFTRKLWERVGGFREVFREGQHGYEDDAFAYDLKKLGVTWIMLPEYDHAWHIKTKEKVRPKSPYKHNKETFLKLYGMDALDIWSKDDWSKGDHGAYNSHPENRG